MRENITNDDPNYGCYGHECDRHVGVFIVDGTGFESVEKDWEKDEEWNEEVG